MYTTKVFAHKCNKLLLFAFLKYQVDDIANHLFFMHEKMISTLVSWHMWNLQILKKLKKLNPSKFSERKVLRYT